MMKIVHFKIKESTFILRDQEILERNFQTHNYRIRNDTPVVYFFSLIKLVLFFLIRGWRYDAYFIRFADWHTAIIALFGKLYGKKLFVVIGGFDVAAIKIFNYGAHLNRSRGCFIRYTLAHATCLLPNSESMVYYENRFITGAVFYGGIKYFAPDTRAKIVVVHNGFDPDRYHCRPGTEKRNLAITVAVVNQERTYYMKGIDKFVESARQLPGYRFMLVGISGTLLKQMEPELPENLVWVPYADPDQLIGFYAESKVFCLFSLSEGMPNALCEAMLCECIPVGTSVTSIPEIIGDTGFIIDEQHMDYAQQIRLAMQADPQMGVQARNRIVTRYSIDRREKALVSVLSGP